MTTDFVKCEVRFMNPYGHDYLEGDVIHQSGYLLSVEVYTEGRYQGKVVEIATDDVVAYKDAE